MRKSIAALFGAAALAITVAACAPTEVGAIDDKPSASTPAGPADDKPAVEPPAEVEAAVEALDLTVVEQSFGQTSYDATTWWYVVIVENPNPDFIFDMASLDVEASNAAGVIVDSDSHWTTLLSGKTALTGTFFDVGAEVISTIELRGPDATAATKAPADETGSFATSEVGAVSDSYSTTVAGNLTANFDTEQTMVKVTIIPRNAAGQIIGQETTYVDRLPVGGTVRFESTFLDVLPADTTYEVFAAL